MKNAIIEGNKSSVYVSFPRITGIDDMTTATFHIDKENGKVNFEVVKSYKKFKKFRKIKPLTEKLPDNIMEKVNFILENYDYGSSNFIVFGKGIAEKLSKDE